MFVSTTTFPPFPPATTSHSLPSCFLWVSVICWTKSLTPPTPIILRSQNLAHPWMLPVLIKPSWHRMSPFQCYSGLAVGVFWCSLEEGNSRELRWSRLPPKVYNILCHEAKKIKWCLIIRKPLIEAWFIYVQITLGSFLYFPHNNWLRKKLIFTSCIEIFKKK